MKPWYPFAIKAAGWLAVYAIAARVIFQHGGVTWLLAYGAATVAILIVGFLVICYSVGLNSNDRGWPIS